MRISDWSSDVCSSDLAGEARVPVARDDLAPDDRDRRGTKLRVERLGQLERGQRLFDVDMRAHRDGMNAGVGAPGAEHQIGRAHVCTPVTNAHLVCRLLLEKKN